MNLFNVFKTLKEFCQWQCYIHDNWPYDDDSTFLSIRPAYIHDVDDIEWAVEETHRNWGDDEIHGFFKDLRRACQFADCYDSYDHDWYDNDESIPYYIKE